MVSLYHFVLLQYNKQSRLERINIFCPVRGPRFHCEGFICITIVTHCLFIAVIVYNNWLRFYLLFQYEFNYSVSVTAHIELLSLKYHQIECAVMCCCNLFYFLKVVNSKDSSVCRLV